MTSGGWLSRSRARVASIYACGSLVVALLLPPPAAQAETRAVTIAAGPITLNAQYTTPPYAPKRPAVVALHGCGGPWATRDTQWQEILGRAGHPSFFPDSFGSRGLGSQCKVADRTVHPGRERRADTVAAVTWLAAQPATPPGGIVVMGWSNGGTTVLAAAGEGVMPAGVVRGFIAFYPGCRPYVTRKNWAPSAPMLILMGAADDWTPAAPCRELAARFPDKITLVTYPGAYHDFDVPGRPVRPRTGLAFTAGKDGVAHTGTDPAGREDAIKQVLAFLDR